MKAVSKKNMVISSILLIIILVIIILRVPVLEFPEDYSTVVLDRNGQLLRVFLAQDQQWRCRAPADSLPIKYRAAVIHFEDKRFYHHPGVDPLALLRAAYHCLKSGTYVSGASTIPMQIARLSNPKSRTPAHKILEMVQAVKLTLTHSKESVLRMYACHAPMGGNIVGLEAACLRYFGKQPPMLSWAEAAALAVLPNSPTLIRLTRGREKLLRKRNGLLERMKNAGVLGDDEYEQAVNEPLPEKEFDMPFSAPHASRLMHSRYPSEIITTTLDESIQRTVQSVVSQHAQETARYGIDNAAVLVAETKTGRVRAYCGSQGFFESGAQGQVDGIQSPRSTGSLLKPFLYAAILDRGDLLPETKIKDVPTYYGTFIPFNASQEFNGMATMKQALIQSLNVPAVRELNYYGLADFQRLLTSAGLTTLFRSPLDYGLTLILGGAEATLWDMCGLYRMLGNGGVASPLAIVEPDGAARKRETILSRGSCWLILECMKELQRPGSEYYWHYFENQWPIAWKTGTSYGQRDAWAIGVTPQWTIGVWAGNFSGEGNPELSGAKTAGPLLFDIVSRLPRNPHEAWFPKPLDDLEYVTICSETGYQASRYCPETDVTYRPLQAKTVKTCPYHKVYYLNQAKIRQVCSLCWGEHGGEADTLLVYSPDAVAQLRKLGYRQEGIPRHKQDCPSLSSDNPITILYPSTQTGLWLPRGIDGEKQKAVLKAAHSNSQARLYWYLDGSYLGLSKKNHEVAVDLETGPHTITLVDDEGHRKRISFTAGSGI